MSSSHVEAIKPASYAQAARGASHSTSAQPSKASSGAVTPARDQTGAPTLKPELHGARWADADDDDTRTSHSTASTAVENQPASNNKSHAATPAAQTNGVASPASVDFGGSSTSTLARDDGASPVSELPESAWDAKLKTAVDARSDAGRHRSSTDRSSSKSRKKTAKRGDKKEKVDVVDEKASKPAWSAPIKLVDAPAPTVNPWLARAQQAKPAVAPIPKPVALTNPTPSATSAAKSSGVDATKSASPAALTSLAQTSAQSKDSTAVGKPPALTEDAESKTKSTQQTERHVERSEQASKVAHTVVDDKAWPTPDTSKQEEPKGKHSQERSETDTHTTHESRGKQAWNKLEFTPTVVFQTALPGSARRGGKGGGRGGHDGRTRTPASSQNDRGNEAKSGTQAGEPTRRERSEATRSSSPGRAKRASNDDAPGRRQSRQESVTRDHPAKQQSDEPKFKPRDHVESASNVQRTKPVRKEAVVNGDKKSAEDNVSKDNATTSNGNTAATAASVNAAKDNKATATDATPAQATTSSTQAENQKKDVSPATSERKNSVVADFASRHHERKGSGTYSTFSGRGRGERGRGGGHRGGRGNGHTFHPNAHSFVNGQGAFNMQGYNAIPKSPTGFGHDPFFGQAPQNVQRYGRNYTGRASSIPDASYGRALNGFPVQSLQLNTGVQANGMFPSDFYMPATAVPYQSDPTSDLLAAVTRQMEYYFSIDNLLKDTYLRKHMDSQGFVLLTFIADFKRLKMMTQDLELIKYVCQQSPNIEHRVGSDGTDRLRAAKGWERWVLEKEERDPSAQHDGPESHHPPPRPNVQLPEHVHFARHSPLPIPQSAGPVLGAQPFQSLNSFAAPYNAYGPSTSSDAQPSISQFQASATAMAPGAVSVPQASAGPFGSPSAQPPLFSNAVEETEPDSFTDSEVEVLRVVLRDLPGETAGTTSSTSQRAQSNGLVEGVNGQRHPSGPNSSATPDESDRATSPTTSERFNRFLTSSGGNSVGGRLAGSRSGSRNGEAQPEGSTGVYYIKDKDSPSYNLPADVTSELYLAARDRAIQQRNFHPCPQDMMNMYQFWEHFLVRHFNARMYMEFRSFAMEDASTRNEFAGLNSLLRYYGKALAYADVPIRRSVAQDYVSLVRSEQPGSDRPAFKQLRAAWRDGALNMKNRKRIKDFLDEALEKELDR
ncbi:uncharacterized protein PV09_09342 [Verruconis gallopava]|uniref:HTH La-type RNA-binding domain-containing protein n=1 Tax=Verruconis gallopava TaxID=253628 RepID=A0A0D1YDT3_9PEZI|nr:uncharacterized protein PV09_09342 [Verruconis gallopava]KIV98896.1 hypothetical protein PV09_09342 [Verruconis gallopava]